MSSFQPIFTAFELHSPSGIRECFNNGIDPNAIVDEKPLVYGLINMYSRGPMLKECMQVFVEHGLVMEDKVLLAVLLDDAAALDALLRADASAAGKRYNFDCTFTPLYEASLLHICAEYNHLQCAEVLVQHGADVNSRAGLDEHGFGGQTPIFHTVNQSDNKSMDVLQFLLSKQADLNITVKGLVWGKGYEWESFIPAVNPISYAMMGLLRQFQRTEEDIYKVVDLLMKAAYGIAYVPGNVPNQYLKS